MGPPLSSPARAICCYLRVFFPEPPPSRLCTPEVSASLARISSGRLPCPHSPSCPPSFLLLGLASQGKAFSQGCFSSRNLLSPSLSCCFGQVCIITPPFFFWADSKHPPLPGFGPPLYPLVTLHSLPGYPPVDLGSAPLLQSVSSLPAPILSPSQEIQSQVTPLCPQPGPSWLPQMR